MKHRRGIFIKMFVWFWVVMTVVITITILIDRLSGSAPGDRLIRRNLEILLTFSGRMAVELNEKGNRGGLIEMRALLRSSTDLESFLLTEDLTDIQGQVVPKEVIDLAAEAIKKGEPAFSSIKGNTLGVIPLHSNSGQTYYMAGSIHLHTFQLSPNESLFFLQRLAIALVISCLACYLLARYLTAPIIRLGEAARRLAAGDLKVRVSPAGGRRWDEIGELAHDFDLMAERIASLITSQQQLLGNISHELRSPLARLNVALELARKASTPEAEKSFRRMEWEAERLNELIGHLLTFARLDSALEELKKEPVDLQALVQDIVDDADFEAHGRNREVKLKESETCVVTGVAELLRSAVENVVRNAVLYTREGTTVTITLQSRVVEERPWALIRVLDQGPGVPEEALADLFRPFFRVESARERQTGGTGLGLAITERAIRLHRGTVRAVNWPGGGLIIEITIPCLDQGMVT
jgi:signal transduction histidine kinase